jgi:hypothetical protein
MSWLWTTFTSWNHRAVQAKLDMGDDARRFRAAIEAEDSIATVAALVGHSHASIHLRKRIFIPHDRRNREIDVIIVADKLYVVEVKNWQGDVWSDGRKWYQRPTQRSISSIEYDDVAEEVEHKAGGLLAFLQKKGIAIDESMVSPLVVVAHSNARLDPRTVGKRPNVMTVEGFKAFVEAKKKSVWATVAAWIPFLAPRDVLSWGAKKAVNEALGGVRTWDVIMTHAGERLQGDIVRISFPVETGGPGSSAAAASGGSTVPATTVLRRDIVKCDVSWASEGWFGLATALWNGRAGQCVVELPPPPTPGSSSRRATATSASPAAPGRRIVVPLTSQKVDPRRVPSMSHVVIQQAGSASNTLVPLCTVAKIDLGDSGASSDGASSRR